MKKVTIHSKLARNSEDKTKSKWDPPEPVNLGVADVAELNELSKDDMRPRPSDKPRKTK
ncbi:hypothetical protein Tco_0022155, partial [Tanacetum coccineum]